MVFRPLMRFERRIFSGDKRENDADNDGFTVQFEYFYLMNNIKTKYLQLIPKFTVYFPL